MSARLADVWSVKDAPPSKSRRRTSLAPQVCPLILGKNYVSPPSVVPLEIDLAIARYLGAATPPSTVERDITVQDGKFMSAIIGPRHPNLCSSFAAPPVHTVHTGKLPSSLRRDGGTGLRSTCSILDITFYWIGANTVPVLRVDRFASRYSILPQGD